MSDMERKEYDKLVRDEIPTLIEENLRDEHPIIHRADDEEFEQRLADKLVEEAEEFRKERNVEELVDLLVVIDSIKEHMDISEIAINVKRTSKRISRGEFRNRLVLDAVEGTEVKDV